MDTPTSPPRKPPTLMGPMPAHGTDTMFHEGALPHPSATTASSAPSCNGCTNTTLDQATDHWRTVGREGTKKPTERTAPLAPCRRRPSLGGCLGETAGVMPV